MITYDVALTTTDNPYDPLDDFVEWYTWDTTNGYHTCAYLARVARTSEELTEEENLIERERAIDEIVSLNITGKYKKIKQNIT
jgi:hypothetical protein